MVFEEALGELCSWDKPLVLEKSLVSCGFREILGEVFLRETFVGFCLKENP